MPDDISKQSTSDTQTPPVASPQKSGGTGRPPRLPRLKAGKKAFLYILLVIIILTGGWLVAKQRFHIGEKVYAQAAGHKVYKQEVDAIKNGDDYISDHDAAVALADKYLTQEMAQQRKLKISQADINARIKQTYSSAIPGQSQQHATPYTRQVITNQLYYEKLAAENVGLYKGKLLVANFSRNVPYQSSLLFEDKAANPTLGDPAAIAADKKYARNFITDLYKQIKAKKISFDQAINMEHKDPQVGEKAYPTQSHSQSFNGPLSQNSLLNAKSIRHKLQTLKLHQVTPPFAVKTPSSAYDKKSVAETYYLVVRLDERSGGKSHLSFPQELAQAKKELGYKVNV